MLIFSLVVGAIVGLLIAVFCTPRVVEYVEAIDIEANASKVYDAIRYQRDLMQWSAWPSETGSECKVAGDDGEVGAQTVFFDKKGNRFGHQSVTNLSPIREVSFALESKGPPHVPTLSFYLIEMDEDITRVLLSFRNDVTPPFHLIQRLIGITRWTREMQCKDLDGLKRFLEKSENYIGEPLAKAA
ncbi:MAG: hypothetical protein AAF559_10755 [Pseudomonadota bacterium]